MRCTRNTRNKQETTENEPEMHEYELLIHILSS